MKSYQQIQEGVYDPNIFKAVFLAGGPGSGKTFVVRQTTGGLGLKILNSDDIYERDLEKAGLDAGKPEDIFSDEGQAIRDRSKEKTKKRQDLWVDGRLGIIIDGTGKDVGKISRQKSLLDQIGYDCYMIFVNTSLDVALERNKRRERSVPEYITRKSHAIVQSNIGKFQNSFGMGNMVIIDNSKDYRELTTQIMDRCSKAVRRLLNNKIKSYTAKRWMATERRLRRR